MRSIPLTKGKSTIVDDVDYDFLMQWKWWYGGKYAVRTHQDMPVLLHRIVAERAGINPRHKIDHINRDRLDNRRHNLRAATKSQNGTNRGPNKNNTSGFKGVCWDKCNRLWETKIQVEGRYHKIGRYPTKTEAAKAYNEAAIKYFGAFAYLNKV